MSHRPLIQTGFLVTAVLALVACVSDDGGRGDTTPQRQPANIKPAMLSMVARDFTDTDANELRDSSLVYVYLFGDDVRYAPSISAEGGFKFTLFGPASGSEGGTQVLAIWEFDAAYSAQAMSDSPLGPRFQFVLDLRPAGKENLPTNQATLGCLFTPTNGAPIASRDTIPVTVGRVR